MVERLPASCILLIVCLALIDAPEHILINKAVLIPVLTAGGREEDMEY